MNQIKVRIWKDVCEYWGAAAALIVYIIVVNLVFHAFCPMVILTGLPCPGCGLTRSVIYLASGRIAQSLYINPMGLPIACILIYFFFNRYIIGREAKGMMVLVVGAVALLIILYIWRMHLFFPGRVPYVYKENNVLAHFSTFYEQILHYLRIL